MPIHCIDQYRLSTRVVGDVEFAVARTRKPSAPSVWSRPEPEERPAPTPLSREKIVAAALSIADEQGLEGVSLRNVAAKLGAGPMRLYTYTATKEGLLELMVDEVYGELHGRGAFEGGWREVLRTFALRLREIARRHPWFLTLLGGRPHMGPNALAFYESLTSAVHRSARDLPAVLAAVRVVNAWAVGTILIEANDFAAQRRTGRDERAEQEASWPWLQAQLATGALPVMARIVHEVEHESADAVFEEGLQCVLEGIAKRVLPRARSANTA